VTCKVVLGGLAVIGILALSAPVAHAGAGGTPSTLTSFFVCHEINGDDPGRTFDVESDVFGPFDASGNPILQTVKIGKGALACAFARLFPPRKKGAPAPDPIDPGPGGEQMTCYPLSNSGNGKVKPPPEYLVFDPLFPNGPLNIAVPPTKLEYLCAPSSYFEQ